MSFIITITGLSGSGKDSLKEILPYPFIISYRTRPIRAGEINGVNGYFVTEADYLEAFSSGEIVDETTYDQYKYWTIEEQFRYAFEQKKPFVYVVDGNGVVNLRERFGNHNVLALWLDVSHDELQNRMRIRGDSDEAIKQRLAFHSLIEERDKMLCDFIVNAERTKEDVRKDVLQIVEGRIKQMEKEFPL